MEWVPNEGRVLDFSNPFITYIYLLFYSMALVAFLFFLSTFFNNREYVLITINESSHIFTNLIYQFFDDFFPFWRVEEEKNILFVQYSFLFLSWKRNHNVFRSNAKGQIISKRFFSGRGFFQKTNENTSHTSKNEFICSFFRRIHYWTICFRN